ncbi:MULTISPECIES: hypothetical protein [Cupriavidus]|uniref:Uncharacterized protein n=1 Tax=Cupriavidus metallidurans TaxID=119219 RepID=A0A2L0XD49_9BURK|nr:hypothetical protein [Cupriavidus metallidurans]AVA38006.1 hypothetical protein C3Z06_30790 [Cupriavidus metallidurans]QBP14527.1 hypothetical protein DDF84_033035 [Cupriavidus metallidurans]
MTESDFIAAAALIVSVVGTGASVLFNHRQKGVNQSQKKLNDRLLAREEAEAAAEKKADVSTAFAMRGSNDRRFKVFNRGRAAARNVRIEFVDGNSILVESQVRSTFPLERLEPQCGVDLIATAHLGLAERKFQVKISWEDETGPQEKIEWPTL